VRSDAREREQRIDILRSRRGHVCELGKAGDPLITRHRPRKAIHADARPRTAYRRAKLGSVTAMHDRLGRQLRDLRISVTDRCNLRCPYCMPREHFGPGFAFLPATELLTFDEIVRLAQAFCAHGVRKIRITGGEPLLRARLEQLVGMLDEIPQVAELALTTNGVLLARRAQVLKEAGLDRVTVSLDALDPAAFRAMSDAPLTPARVLGAIGAAIDAGLLPVKVNMVVRRAVNDHCVLEMAERFRDMPGVVLRFIEYMDVGTTNGWQAQDVIPAAQILREIHARWPVQRMEHAADGEVATRYRYKDGGGEIGVIHAVSNPFCASCTRARLSADGRLHTCLYAADGTDLRALVRSGASDRDLAEAVAAAWRGRSDRYSAERFRRRSRPPRGTTPRAPEMSYIGG
jgi:GTP 3',8-cyclase